MSDSNGLDEMLENAKSERAKQQEVQQLKSWKGLQTVNELPDSVTRMFGVESTDPGLQLAEKQLDNDVEMLEALIDARKKQYPIIDDFSRISGIYREDLERFEHDPVDFSLDFVRLYALSLGAEVTHSVQMY